MVRKNESKTQLAKSLGVSRSSLYYKSKLKRKDWSLKQQIEEVLHLHPSYGHKRLATYLGINKKRILRAMKVFGIKPYRRRGRKPKKSEKARDSKYPNLLLAEYPNKANDIWVSDFTYIPFKGRFVYLATVVDIFTRKVVGFSVMTKHDSHLVSNALLCAIHQHSKPKIIHSDQGSEYHSKYYTELVGNLGIHISMSRKGSPWENGYQESFYSQFKVDLGDPNRFDTLGELVYAIYRQIHYYNNERIHTALGASPVVFAKQHVFAHNIYTKVVSQS